MRKTVLIIGVNGFLGSHLAKCLEDDFNIIGLLSRSGDDSRIKDLKLKLYINDSVFNYEEIFDNHYVHAVIHAATVYRKSLDEVINTNILLPVRFAELCTQYGVKQFINTDSFFNSPSFNAYNYLSEYTMAKKHALEWLKYLSASSSLTVISMKLFHMYGKGDSESKFITSIINRLKKNEKSIDLTEGRQKRDFIHITDVVSAYKCVLNESFKTPLFKEYEVGTGESYSVKELVDIVKAISKSKTTLNFGALEYRDGEVMYSKANNLELKSLGWSPKYSLVEGLKLTV